MTGPEKLYALLVGVLIGVYSYVAFGFLTIAYRAYFGTLG